VGGTNLKIDATLGVVTSETVWYWAAGDGTGGGISGHFNRPAWQTGPGVIAGTMRLVPDVAAVGDWATGAWVVLNGAREGGGIGGTSWSAPIGTGSAARINQARANFGQPPLGVLGPHIYPLIGTPCFRDITSGTKRLQFATPGYDMCAGVGTPQVAALIKALTPLGRLYPGGVDAAQHAILCYLDGK